MGKIELTEASAEAIRREARRELENSIGEAHLSGEENAEYRAAHRQNVLDCAEVLGSMSWADLHWEEENSQDVEFSDRALQWMRQCKEETRAYVAVLDDGEEGDFEYNAERVYLLHVLDGVTKQREEVTV
jgi:hypothetical protein